MVKDNNFGLFIVVIVSVVAIVSLFLISGSSQTSSEEVMIVDEEGNLVGDATIYSPSSDKVMKLVRSSLEKTETKGVESSDDPKEKYSDQYDGLEQGTQIDRGPPIYPNYIETCDDNEDNDHDNKIDCYDPDCHEEVCNPGYTCNYDFVRLNEEVISDIGTICDEKDLTAKINEEALSLMMGMQIEGEKFGCFREDDGIEEIASSAQEAHEAAIRMLEIANENQMEVIRSLSSK